MQYQTFKRSIEFDLYSYIADNGNDINNFLNEILDHQIDTLSMAQILEIVCSEPKLFYQPVDTTGEIAAYDILRMNLQNLLKVDLNDYLLSKKQMKVA